MSRPALRSPAGTGAALRHRSQRPVTAKTMTVTASSMTSPGRGLPCDITNEHGTCVGVFDCHPEQEELLCAGQEPEADICNALDDDCDGVADEAFVDEEGVYSFDDNCGFCGITCEGSIPNATATCDGGESPPVCVVDTCNEGFVKSGAKSCAPANLGLCAHVSRTRAACCLARWRPH